MDEKSKKLLTRSSERISFAYIEKARIEQTEFGIQMVQGKTFAEIPITTVNCLVFGPGVSITHRAMENIASAGCSVCWMGENMCRFYAYGEPATHHSKNILVQMRYHENKQLHLAVVHRMYEKRYPNAKIKSKDLSSLRGFEGLSVKKKYEELSEKYQVDWNGRVYTPDDFEGQDTVNKYLTALNQYLYAVIQAILVTMGYSPAIGYIHTGNMRSFVFDIADLYKERYVMDAAFELAAKGDYDRRAGIISFRRLIVEKKLMSKIVKDISELFSDATDAEYPEIEGVLWDYTKFVNSGKNYSETSD